MIACTKENNDYKSVGTITGIAGTMCGCCGGWIINIDNNKLSLALGPLRGLSYYN